MNKKLMALSLVVGMSFSQMPLQAGLIDRFMGARGIETLCNLVKQPPVYSIVAIGSVLGLAYLYNYKITRKTRLQEQKIIFSKNDRSEKEMESVKEFVSKVVDNTPMEKDFVVISDFVIKQSVQDDGLSFKTVSIQVIEPSNHPYNSKTYSIVGTITAKNKQDMKNKFFQEIAKIFNQEQVELMIFIEN